MVLSRGRALDSWREALPTGRGLGIWLEAELGLGCQRS